MGQTPEGAMKAAAKRVGLPLGEYLERLANGLKRCTICCEWKAVDLFNADRTRSDGRSARCKRCAKAIWRRRSLRSNKPRKPRRDGDKLQARSRINHDVRLGLRPDPNSLHCAICGHKGEDRRHEYHHLMGYAPEHHYDVLPLCSRCHSEEHHDQD